MMNAKQSAQQLHLFFLDVIVLFTFWGCLGKMILGKKDESNSANKSNICANVFFSPSYL